MVFGIGRQAARFAISETNLENERGFTNVESTEEERPKNKCDFVAPVPPLEAELPFMVASIVYLQVQRHLTVCYIVSATQHKHHGHNLYVVLRAICCRAGHIMQEHSNDGLSLRF